MEFMISYIIAVYFSIGAAAIGLINRKKDRKSAREGWIKYFVYLFIVLAMLSSMKWKPAYLAVLAFILLVSLREIVVAWLKSESRNMFPLVSVLLLFLSAGACLIFFAVEGRLASQLIVYTIVFSFDGFSQVTGQLFGKKKLVPVISPGKTVGGLLGGTIAALLTGWLLFPYRNIGSEAPLLHPVLVVVLLSLLIAASAFWGDLAASAYKRKTGVKDFSSLIRGHGGMLDRFDSFIAAGAVMGLLELAGILQKIAIPLVL